MEQASGFPSVSNMADGNRSAKGKSVIVDNDYEIGSTSGHKQGSHGDFNSCYDSHGGSRAAHDNGYSAHLLPTNFDDNNMFSTFSLPLPLPLTIAPTYYQHVDPGYYELVTGHSGGGTTTSFPYANGGGGGGASFPSPHLGDGIGLHYAPHHAHAPNSRRSSSPLPWSMEQIDSFIGNSLRSLSIRDRVDSLLAHGGRRRLSEFMNNLQEPQDLVGTEDDDGQNHPRRGVLNSNADQLYVGRRLEDVRGAMSSVARNTPGCRFLVRMVAEGGAAAAQQVLHEVAGDVLRLMVHADGHALVEALVQHLTDDHMACVLQILDAASPAQIVAVARNHQG
jgi:hypothetical protein